MLEKTGLEFKPKENMLEKVALVLIKENLTEMRVLEFKPNENVIEMRVLEFKQKENVLEKMALEFKSKHVRKDGARI